MDDKRGFEYSMRAMPWLQRYEYYQNHHDLLPFWYASPWIDLPLEQGAAGEININIGHPFWLYDIVMVGQQNNVIEDEPLVTAPSFSIPAVEFRLKLDGQQAWGSWSDVQMASLAAAEITAQLGEGYILERGAFATIEYRRVVTEPVTDATEERIQFILSGSQIWPKGSLVSPSGWRNMTMGDWSQKAVTSPYRYGTRIETDNDEIGNVNNALGSVPLTLRTRDRDFIWERMYLAQYASTTGVAIFGAPYATFGAPIAMTMLVQDIPVHNPALQGVAQYAFHRFALLDGGGFNSRSLRIPRLIPANSIIEIQAGFWQWATPTDDPDFRQGDMFIVLVGDEIIGDDRTAAERRYDLT